LRKRREVPRGTKGKGLKKEDEENVLRRPSPFHDGCPKSSHEKSSENLSHLKVKGERVEGRRGENFFAPMTSYRVRGKRGEAEKRKTQQKACMTHSPLVVLAGSKRTKLGHRERKDSIFTWVPGQ